MSIHTKIILLPLSVALLVALLMSGGMFLSEQRAMRIIHDRELATAQAWLESSITRTHEVALAQAEVLASLPVVQKAVADRDDLALERLLGPGFEHMKALAGVVQMQFHTPPATSLIRIHNLAKRGDDLSAFRQTVVDANTAGTSLSGLERGRAGLGARGVAVVHYQGRAVGTVEVGLDIGMSFLEGLADRSGNDYEFYLIPDQEIATFDAADQTDYRLGATIDRAPLLSSADLAQLLTDGRLDRDVDIDGAGYALRGVPIRDYAGDVAGVVTILSPTDDYGVLGRQLMSTALISALVALVIGTGVGYFNSRTLASRFADVVVTMERLARGDPTLEVRGTNRNDEIGGIFRALKMFQQKMQENVEMAQTIEAEEAERRQLEAAERAREARDAEARRKAEQTEAQRQRDLSEAQARAAQAEQAATEARMREQEDVVKRLAEGLDALAAGDLTHAITQAMPGEYETLRLNYNRAVAQLRDTMQALNRTADSIDTEVTSIASASDDLSRRSERNAATLEETAAALDELTASVRAANASTAEVRRLIDEANRNADNGSASVTRAVDAMNRIEDSSSGIAKITTVIDEIAFQTNLLALNAGVEAARAGEAGRGFAVVASEVRALAQRSSDAAKEISDLIGSSEGEVRQGVELVGETGAALERILASVRNISEQVILIANSSEEQATGLGEINAAVNQLDGTTQQNAAMFEETSAATSVLSSMTKDLATAIRQFRTDRSAYPAPEATRTGSPAAA